MENYEWSPVARQYDPILVGSIDATDTDPHDHGIIRALNSKYKPNKGVEGDPECTIFVGRLNHATDENALKNLFTRYGQVKRCRLVRDFITGHSKGYGFVEFTSRSDAKYAIGKMNHALVDDKTIIVMFECERTLPGWIPRRLGGGFGGKKESGQLRFGGTERPFRKPIVIPTKMAEHVRDSEKMSNAPRGTNDERRVEKSPNDRNGERESNERHPRRQSTLHGGGHRREEWRHSPRESDRDRRHQHRRHERRSRSRDSSGSRGRHHKERNPIRSSHDGSRSPTREGKLKKGVADGIDERRRRRTKRCRIEDENKQEARVSPKKYVKSQLSLSPE